MDEGLGIRVKLGRLPVGHKPHPPTSPRSLPILSGVVDVPQEKRLPGVLIRQWMDPEGYTSSKFSIIPFRFWIGDLNRWWLR